MSGITVGNAYVIAILIKLLTVVKYANAAASGGDGYVEGRLTVQVQIQTRHAGHALQTVAITPGQSPAEPMQKTELEKNH